MDHQQEISQILTEPQYTSLPVEINKGHVNHGVSKFFQIKEWQSPQRG
jgi:hypothetical protein